MSTPTGYTSIHTAAQIDEAVTNVYQNIPEGYAMVMALAMMGTVSTIAQVTNPEWKFVLTDHDDRILLGIKQDNTICVYASVGDIMDVINDSYTTT